MVVDALRTAPLRCGGHYSHGTAPNNPLPERLGRANARYCYVCLCFIF